MKKDMLVNTLVLRYLMVIKESRLQEVPGPLLLSFLFCTVDAPAWFSYTHVIVTAI